MFKEEFLLMIIDLLPTIGRSPFPFLDDSHRRRRGLIVQQNHRSGEISPFAEERKETERDVAVFLARGEQQIERTLLAVVDDSYPQRRSRGVEHTHRSHQMSPFTAARREREREKGRKRKNAKEAKDTSPPAISTATPGKEETTLPVLN
ncbi:hypothetical protein DY000_02063009 [Brassica cretica]|uniref:Uncharacterized protein n=1 Tax=Brassica cretica TaxID=69181 RepID=A0ABQ7AYU3_BRACR|nr:hypothetical protein DY000_02063009 [Brassica cretica]